MSNANRTEKNAIASHGEIVPTGVREATVLRRSPITEIHRVNALARYVVGFAVLAGTCLLLVLVLLPLLPARGLRIRAGNLVARPMAAVCLRLAGIQLDIVHHGRPNQRGIYVMNHSSHADPLVAMRLCPVGGCGVAKAEIRWVPMFGLAYWLSGHLLIDRGSSERAVGAFRALVPVIERHRLGVWLWPEGTLSRDGALLPFKRGFVHLAIQTGLPVIPVVAHGLHRRWPPRTIRLWPGPVRVDVLAPIDTSGWRVEDADAHAAAVRALMADRLAAP